MKPMLFISCLLCMFACKTEAHIGPIADSCLSIDIKTVQTAKQLTQEEKKKVRALAAKVSDETRMRYAGLLEKWEEAIKTDSKTRLAASTSAYTQLKEFDALRNMGCEIIPLIMEGMMDGQKPYLLKLYRAISSDGDKSGADCQQLSEQDKATKAIRAWLSNSKEIRLD